MYSGSICYLSVLRVREYQLFSLQHFHCQRGSEASISTIIIKHRVKNRLRLRTQTQCNTFGEIFGPFKKLGNIKQTSWFTFCRGSRLTTPADWDIGRQPIKITLCQNRPNSNDGIFDSVSISFLSHPSEERGPGLYWYNRCQLRWGGFDLDSKSDAGNSSGGRILVSYNQLVISIQVQNKVANCNQLKSW